MKYVLTIIAVTLVILFCTALRGAYVGKRDGVLKFDTTDKVLFCALVLYSLAQIGNIYYLLK